MRDCEDSRKVLQVCHDRAVIVLNWVVGVLLWVVSVPFERQ